MDYECIFLTGSTLLLVLLVASSGLDKLVMLVPQTECSASFSDLDSFEMFEEIRSPFSFSVCLHIQ